MSMSWNRRIRSQESQDCDWGTTAGKTFISPYSILHGAEILLLLSPNSLLLFLQQRLLSAEMPVLSEKGLCGTFCLWEKGTQWINRYIDCKRVQKQKRDAGVQSSANCPTDSLLLFLPPLRQQATTTNISSPSLRSVTPFFLPSDRNYVSFISRHHLLSLPSWHVHAAWKVHRSSLCLSLSLSSVLLIYSFSTSLTCLSLSPDSTDWSAGLCSESRHLLIYFLLDQRFVHLFSNWIFMFPHVKMTKLQDTVCHDVQWREIRKRDLASVLGICDTHHCYARLELLFCKSLTLENRSRIRRKKGSLMLSLLMLPEFLVGVDTFQSSPREWSESQDHRKFKRYTVPKWSSQ